MNTADPRQPRRPADQRAAEPSDTADVDQDSAHVTEPGNDDPGRARRTTIDAKTLAAIREAAARLLADAPPLSAETRERLAALLSTTTYRHPRKARDGRRPTG